MNLSNIFLHFIVVGMLGCPSLLGAEEWTPRRIVGLSYPRLAEQSSTQGTVQIECILNEGREVLNTRILSVSGPKPGVNLLANAAQKNAARWTFLSKGKFATGESPNRVAVIIYEFTLEGGSDTPESEFTFDLPNVVRVKSQAQHWMP